MIGLYIRGAVARSIERDLQKAKEQADQGKFKKFLKATLVVKGDEIFTAVMSTHDGSEEVEVEYI